MKFAATFEQTLLFNVALSEPEWYKYGFQKEDSREGAETEFFRH